MLTAAALISSIALAQPDATAPAEQRQPDPLAGPSVDDQQTKTLVVQSMARGFVPVEGRPELAAAQLIDADDDARAAIESIADDRVTDLTVLLVDRIDDVREMTDLLTTGQGDQAREILLGIWTDHDNRSHTPMLESVQNALNPHERAQLTALIDEYWAAWINAERQPGETDDQTRDRLAFQLFQQEIQRAYEVSLGNTRRALEGIYDAVDPTPEQRAEIRSLVIEHIKATRLKATPTQRRAVMRRIYDTLDEDRRAKLFDYMTRAVLPDNG